MNTHRLVPDGNSLHNKENTSLQVELTPEGISLRNAKGAGLSWRLEGAKPCPPKAVEQEAKIGAGSDPQCGDV